MSSRNVGSYMQIYRELEKIEKPFHHACVTIGNFDGVHLGHQLLFSEVVQRAYRSGGTSIAVTFNPHPLQILRPDGIKLISNCDQKSELIDMAGLDVLIIVPFTKKFASMAAEEFVDDFLVGRIGVKELVVGYDYAFGKGRRGNIQFLREQGTKCGFSVSVVEAHYENSMLVSSTKVRKLVAEGRMIDASKLLGHPYQIRGVVQIGKQRGGKEIGFPTANLSIDEEDLVPKIGVYVTQVICEGKCYGGVLNIGYNPTFGDEKLVAETHIFDFDRNIYGKPMKINLLKFLRPERKFASVPELAAQISRDAAQAKQVLADQEQELTLSCFEKYNR